jgi:aminoglycoside/choline kinase family phosphotransferase
MRLRSVDSYEREVRFYQQLAPHTELPTPTCYYADIDLATGDHIILLQDLAPLHSGSRLAGCTPAQARTAIHHVAKLHTTWWGKTEGEELAWLSDGDRNPDAEQLRQIYDQWWPAFYQQAQAQLPETLAQFSQQLGSRRAMLRKQLFGASPRTLIHRDYQLENLFFGAGQGSGPEFVTEFAIVDWQFFSRGRCVWDVAYFLSESLLPDDRRAVEMELLALYHQSLVAHGIQEYTFEQCLYDYRLCLLQRHTALVSTIAAMPFSAEQRHIHINILLPRNIAAILDHHAHTMQL